MPADELLDPQNDVDHHIERVRVRLVHPFALVPIWYEHVVNVVDQPRMIAIENAGNDFLQKLNDKRKELYFPQTFPFLSVHSDVLPEYGIDVLDHILLLPTWSGIFIVKKYHKRLEKVIMLFIRKHREKFEAYQKNRKETTPLIEKLYDILGEKLLTEYIQKSFSQEQSVGRPQKRQKLQETPSTPSVEEAKLVIYAKMTDRFLNFQPSIPEGYDLEVTTEEK